MSDGLDVIILDDDSSVCEILEQIIRRFYTWGNVLPFTRMEEAVQYCQTRQSGVAVFVLDVYIGELNCFGFLDAIADRFPMAYEDSVIITGNASDDVVNMCVASDITHLLEKPVRAFALQLAVRSIVNKYMRFAKKLLQDPVLAESVSKF